MAGEAFVKAVELTDEEIDALEPNIFGPTWQREVDGSWKLPARTLGWEIAAWTAKYLKAEDGGPWRFTLEQLRFILWWYAVDEDGRFIYRKGVLQRLKGWGKDPLAAVMCLVEFVGPSRFSHFDESGRPVGKAHPQAWVQIAAVSRDQTRNTLTLFPSLMSDLLIETYGIKAGAELIRAHRGRCRLEAVTSSYRALEGGRSTFVILNETHHWVRGNNGDKMYETIDGNATKKDSRYLAITNAYLPGEDSVAQKMRESWEKLQERIAADPSKDIGFLYDSIEAHPKTPLTEQALRIVLPKIRGDAKWLVVKTIIQSIQDTTISSSRSRRMWLNQIVAEEDALYGPDTWAEIESEDAVLQPDDAIVLGFDGGKTNDSTALVAIRVRDACAFLIGLWEKPDTPDADGWEVPRAAVNSAVHDAFRLYDVKGFYSDVYLWESYISEWDEQYSEQLQVKAPGRTHIGWDMRSSLKLSTQAHERLMNSVFNRKMRHNGDLKLRRHALNALRDTNNYGIYFRKESPDSPRKVDAYAALMLAHECLHDLRARGKKTKPKTGNAWFM